MSSLAEQIDEQLQDWFAIVSNANQYELEKILEKILRELREKIVETKEKLADTIKDAQNTLKLGNLPNYKDWDESDENYNEYVSRNYEKTAKTLAVIALLEKQIKKFGQIINADLIEQIEFLSQYNYGLNAESFWVAGLEIDIPGMTAKQLDFILDYKYDPQDQGLGRNDRIQNLTDRMQKEISQIIIGGILAGLSLEEIMKRIEPMFPSDEKNGWIYNSLDTLIRTEIQVAAIAAAMLAMWQKSSLMEGYQYSAVWDNRICQICADLASEFGDTIFLPGMFPVVLPIHPRCRCQKIPVMVPWTKIAGLYHLAEELVPSRIRVRSTTQEVELLKQLRGEVKNWQTIKLPKYGLTIQEYPDHYFEDWLFMKESGSYVFKKRWETEYRKEYNKLAPSYGLKG